MTDDNPELELTLGTRKHGVVTIPETARRYLDVTHGDLVYVHVEGDGEYAHRVERVRSDGSINLPATDAYRHTTVELSIYGVVRADS